MSSLFICWLFALTRVFKPGTVESGLLILFILVTIHPINAQSVGAMDVLHYQARVEPYIKSKTLKGNVSIRFKLKVSTTSTIRFDCGSLQVDSVRENSVPVPFQQRKHQLSIFLPSSKTGQVRKLDITYHGSPKYGINYYPDLQQVYTVFSTSQWLVCHDHPSDKASLELDLVLPRHLKAVGNGQLLTSSPLGEDRILYRWRENTSVPTYTFGFAAGPFREFSQQYEASDNRPIKLRYLAASYSQDEIGKIFRYTPEMLRFFEKKAGVPYPNPAYTQVLAAGTVAQEMSGFTVIRDNYGEEVLADEKALWLFAHELAHQWWGNQVTCQDWNHFWLNEGMATFMAAAYKEHQFGRSEYLKDIEAAKASYLKVREAGKDRSLVFPDWNNPSAEDRALVYHKGAYVLHLLREEVGEELYWQGIKAYTRTFWGKSVTTADFQRTMEKASGRNLSAFFAKWVHLKGE